MDPPSPSKFPMSPGMPIFPVSPERAAGTKPPYGAPAPQSPSLPDLRMSPLRKHRRNDSDVSVQGLAAMFENLEVKDFKEAQAKYMATLQKQSTKHANEIRQLEKENALNLSRRQVRIEELESQLQELSEIHSFEGKKCVARRDWDAARQEQRAAIAKWENAMRKVEEDKGQMVSKIDKMHRAIDSYKAKCHVYKQQWEEKNEKCDKMSNMLPSYKGKIQGLERSIQRLESDLKFHTGEAEKYRSQVYNLQIDVEASRSELGEEVQTLKDRLRLVEGERDALKTSLQEEEVLRIAAEGHIPLPAATTEEHDEFESPVRSPRKQRTPERDEEDKENVAPRKAVVELKLAQQELATEKRLRERAQEQVEFMKMECQFRCCSCRIADDKGAHYIHDDSYAVEMERLKASVPVLTPPPSSHGEDPMEGVIIKQEPVDDERPFTPPVEEPQPAEENVETTEQTMDTTVLVKPLDNATPEPLVTFSPTTGTFRSVSSPVEAPASTHIATPAKPSRLGLSAITEVTTESSPWTPDANSTMVPKEAMPPPPFGDFSRPASRVDTHKEREDNLKCTEIVIHEDVVADSDEENEPQTPVHGPPGPATPGQYLTRTITTTTTVPLHFSPMTPATKPGNQLMTPSTVAHAPADARTPVLGELSLNRMPFNREAALEAIRQRRGRARSMAAGHGTPRKQMMDGVKERRDISAPVSRVRR